MVDLALSLLLVALALAALHARTLYGAILLFFAFGMLMSLAWARLRAPDLALAEAAIGAGLTGVLLFSALHKSRPEFVGANRLRHPLSAGLLAMIVLVVVVQALRSTTAAPGPLPALVDRALADSGVEHPVTAVLVNFRAWDTLLEITVLLVAVLGVKVLKPTAEPSPRPWPVLFAWGRTLTPICVLVSGYLLWRGSHGPGGAFQAGALLAAAAVMLRLSHALPPLRWSNWLLRASLLGGLVMFLGAAVASMIAGAGWLQYPPAAAGPLIVAIEVFATASIAVALTLLVVGEGNELQS